MFKCKLILSLLKTTPEQPNPSEAKGQKHHFIHHNVELHRYPCTLQAVWITVAKACPQMFFLHVWRLFRWSDSDMTYLSHVIVFLVTSPISGMFSSLVCLHAQQNNYSLPALWNRTKAKENVTGLQEKRNESECGSLWFPYAQVWQSWLPQGHVNQKLLEHCHTLEKTTKQNAKTLGWREVQCV